jgi:circadian clock protein KaiC
MFGTGFPQNRFLFFRVYRVFLHLNFHTLPARSLVGGLSFPFMTKTLGSMHPSAMLSTGVVGLDDVLLGGLARNHLFLVSGDPGTGKTTLGLQFLLDGVAHGETVMYVALSESKAELTEVARSHGWSLEGVHIFEMVPSEEELSPEAQYTVFHPAEVELADALSSVLKEVDAVRPQRIVFDSLSELRMLARDALRYRRQILALKRHFVGSNCTCMLLDDRTIGGDDQQLQSIAHGVILLQSLDRTFGIKRRRLEVRKMRGTKFREGFHDFTIRTGGLEVFPRLVASDYVAQTDMGPIHSGIESLDALFGGGIDSGTTTLLLGPAGCGKSSVAALYVHSAANRGESAAVFSFDETRATYLKRTHGLGIAIEDGIDSGKILLQQIDPAEMSVGEFVTTIRSYVEEHKARVIVIDSLNGLIHAMPDEEFLLLQMHELFSYLNRHGVTTLCTMAQSGFMGRTDSPVDISYLADSVLIFRYFEAAGEVRQALSVAKKRSGSHERSIRELFFTGGSIRVGEALASFEGILTGNPRFAGNIDRLEKHGKPGAR